MADVFVSYKAEDRQRVKPLVEALKADGLTVWWDVHIGAGEAWRETIERQLDGAKCVLVIWSKRSVGPEGRFVRDEASRAQRRGVYVPLLIDGVDLPLGFGESQATSLRHWHGNRSDPHYEAVLSVIRKNIGGEGAAAARSIQQPRVDRRTIIASAAVAAVAATGVGAWAVLKSGPGPVSGSIAVLPFANLSGDPSQSFLSDGLAEELRSALARISKLEVVGRTSSEAVRNDDTETAAKKLAVANILIGSIRRSPSRVRITAELVDGRTGITGWSATYDRIAGDILDLETNISDHVTRALSIILTPANRRFLLVGETANPAAHALYLQASELMLSETSEPALTSALHMLERSVELDPTYAKAHAKLADVLYYLGVFPSGAAAAGEPFNDFARAAAEARHAIVLAPEMPEGHLALGAVYDAQLNIAASFEQLREAYRLNASAHTTWNYAGVLTEIGQAIDAIPVAARAVSLDPLNPDTYGAHAVALQSARKYSEAISVAKRGTVVAPDAYFLNDIIAQCQLMLGNTNAALVAYRHRPAADDPYRLLGEALTFARAGDHAASWNALKKLTSLTGSAAAYQQAEVLAQLGETERALTALETALRLHDGGLTDLLVDAFLDPLRREPRFQAVVRELNFPRIPL